LEKRRSPSSAPFANSSPISGFPNNAPPPTYLDTICEIVGKWPGLDKQAIIREGEKLRDSRHLGKKEETVKSGFQNVFSTQSKKEKPRTQGWDFGQIDAEGKAVSTCRWLLAGKDPKSVQLWEAPSVPLASGNHDRATTRDARYDSNDVQEKSLHIRHAAGTDEGGHTPEEPVENETQRIRGLPEGVDYHGNLQGTTSYAHTSDQDSRLPQLESGEITGDRQSPPQEPVVQDESAEKNAFDEWSERAQSNFWGYQVCLKKNILSKLRDTEGNLTKLSCRSAQLKEFKERDEIQLGEIKDRMQALRERMREQATETEQVHQKECIASEAASDLRKQIHDIDEKLDQYWAEDD
jgi:hypothetical protein